MKSKRHEKILELIRDNDIETQEQLLQQLQENGFNTTQQPEGFPWSGSVADIKALGTHKWLLLRRRTKNIKIKARY